ncbi:hypothetical protein [Streptomyces sp. 147326]|uniref:hypothetical protein n=1 Tax=Streptomyces sp. 147326 TaxID=3074379 RepID=UPI003857726C
MVAGGSGLLALHGEAGRDPQPVDRGAGLQNAAFVWVPVLIVLALVAWFGQNDLKVASTPFSQQKIIFRRKHNWLMTWLYVGTFGSFIGFAAGLPLLIQNNRGAGLPGHHLCVDRPLRRRAHALGRRLALRQSRRRQGHHAVLRRDGRLPGRGGLRAAARRGSGQLRAFFIGFLAAFAFSGLGNASTFRQIPVIFRDQHMREAEGQGPEAQAAALKQSEMEAGAVTGFSSAIAAYGFLFIPAVFAAMAVTHALWLFIGFYASCLAVCWWFYARKGAEASS